MCYRGPERGGWSSNNLSFCSFIPATCILHGSSLAAPASVEKCTNGMCLQQEAAQWALCNALHNFCFWTVSGYSPSQCSADQLQWLKKLRGKAVLCTPGKSVSTCILSAVDTQVFRSNHSNVDAGTILVINSLLFRLSWCFLLYFVQLTATR